MRSIDDPHAQAARPRHTVLWLRRDAEIQCVRWGAILHVGRPLACVEVSTHGLVVAWGEVEGQAVFRRVVGVRYGLTGWRRIWVHNTEEEEG